MAETLQRGAAEEGGSGCAASEHPVIPDCQALIPPSMSIPKAASFIISLGDAFFVAALWTAARRLAIIAQEHKTFAAAYTFWISSLHQLREGI